MGSTIIRTDGIFKEFSDVYVLVEEAYRRLAGVC